MIVHLFSPCQMRRHRRLLISSIILLLVLPLMTACEAAAVQVVPTALPTITATATASPTRTPGVSMTGIPTRPTRVAADATAGPSPTSLFGATRTPVPRDFATPTRLFNPNAPRIEFFTSDPLQVEPGARVTLFWSARNIDNAVIYRLDSEGNRTRVYNVAPDGNLPIDTRSSDRGALRFVLGVGEGGDYTEDELTIPLQCPIDWFFSPPPDTCAIGDAVETTIIDQTMERGRMLYVESEDRVYTLFNDGNQPGWSSFPNRFDPATDPSRDPNAPPEFIQPLNELGFVWRGNDTVRNRLGLGEQEAIEFQGFIQRAPGSGGQDTLYISGANGIVLQLLPGNELWQVIGSS